MNFHSYCLDSEVNCIQQIDAFLSVTEIHSKHEHYGTRKAPKKSEEAVESSSPEGDVVFDSTPHAIDSIKSWRKFFETLDYEIKNFSDDSENKLWDIVESQLHKVATRP